MRVDRTVFLYICIFLCQRINVLSLSLLKYKAIQTIEHLSLRIFILDTFELRNLSKIESPNKRIS
jgi:hypothetical protein